MVTPQPPATLLIDTSSAIACCECSGRTDLFDKLIEAGFAVALPPAVWIEFGEGPAAKALRSNPKIGSFEPSKQELGKLAEQFPLLGRGELAVLAQGLVEKGAMCVLDDGRARKAAAKVGVRFTGTIGLLQALVEHGKLTSDQRDTILACLRQAGFRLPADV